jgi:hypothetical protein
MLVSWAFFLFNLIENLPQNSQHDHKSFHEQNHRFRFTQQVINSIGLKTLQRTPQLVASLMQHFHDFARENELVINTTVMKH